jgi:transposase
LPSLSICTNTASLRVRPASVFMLCRRKAMAKRFCALSPASVCKALRWPLSAASKSQIAGFALEQFSRVYDIEREVKDLDAEQRKAIRQQQSKPVLDALHQWMALQRQKVPDSSATAKALDYSLRRWVALTRFVDDGQLPVDNNWIENQIRPISLGRSNWLFAGSLRAGQRAAAVMSLIQSARMSGHDPYAYLKDVLTCIDPAVSAQVRLLKHKPQQGCAYPGPGGAAGGYRNQSSHQ